MKGGFSRKNKKGLGGALSGGLLGQLLGESGKTISDADRAMLQAIMGSAGVGAGDTANKATAAAALKGSGTSISNADMARIQKLLSSMKSPRPKTDRQLMQFEDGGKVKKPKKLPKPKPKIGDLNEMGPIYTDTKTGKKVNRLNKGGAAVPSKLKGFSKLPEDVQMKMDPVAAAKYEDGGEVRGMGRAYMGASRKAKIR